MDNQPRKQRHCRRRPPQCRFRRPISVLVSVGICQTNGVCSSRQETCFDTDGGQGSDGPSCFIDGLPGRCTSNSTAQAAQLQACLRSAPPRSMERARCYRLYSFCWTQCHIPGEACGPEHVCGFLFSNSTRMQCVELGASVDQRNDTDSAVVALGVLIQFDRESNGAAAINELVRKQSPSVGVMFAPRFFAPDIEFSPIRRYLVFVLDDVKNSRDRSQRTRRPEISSVGHCSGSRREQCSNCRRFRSLHVPNQCMCRVNHSCIRRRRPCFNIANVTDNCSNCYCCYCKCCFQLNAIWSLGSHFLQR